MMGRDRTRGPRAGAAAQWAIALGLAAATVVGCAAQNKQDKAKKSTSAAEKYYDVAVGSFHNGMFEDAKLQLEKALHADPKHADSHYLRGVLLLNEGRTIVDAIEIDRCLTDAAAEHQRERAQQLHAAARDSFKSAATAYEDNDAGRGRAYNSLAVVSLQFHDHARAIGEATEALRSQFYGERFSALTNLGWAYYGKGDMVEATTELRQAVLLNPDFCVGRYRLAQVYLESDSIGEALEQAQAVVDNERCPIQDAHRIAGVAHLRLGQPTEAAEQFDACVAVAPRSCLAAECARFVAPAPAATQTAAR